MSKVSRLSAPLPGSPETPVTGPVSAKGSAKKVRAETRTPSSDVDDVSGRRGGRPCDKAACVKTGLKARCFAGATQRLVLPVLLFSLNIFLIFFFRVAL